MRRLLSLVLILSVLAVACSSSEPVRQRTVRLDAVIVGEDGDTGRRLRVLFVGGPVGRLVDDPCAGEYEVEASESDDEITVTVYELALADVEPTSCTLEGHSRELEIELVDPVGERAVVDGHDGALHWLVDPTDVLWPQSLPDGWIVRSRSASDGRLVSWYGTADNSDESIVLVAGPINTESGWTLDAATSQPGTTQRAITVRGGSDGSAAEITSEDSNRIAIAFDEGAMHYRATGNGASAIDELYDFVAGLELDPTSRTLQIPFDAPIAIDPNQGSIIPTPTAVAPDSDGAPTPIEPGDSDQPPEPELAWPAAESTRDGANYLEALRRGAFEQAAWPAFNNGVAFDGQSGDETGAEYLERMCGVDLCAGPYLIRGEPGYINPLTSQALATVSVMHLGSGEEVTMTLFTFEGQRMISSLPPLVASDSDASLRESLFGDSVPDRVVVERFDAFEIWDGAATEWVTNWHADDTVQIEGDVISTWAAAIGLRDPLQDFRLGCPRLLERDGQVLAVDQCVNDQWAVVDVATGEQVEAPVPFEPAGEASSAWFAERGGAVVTGVNDAEGNLVTLRSIGGVDLLGDDYASLAVISVDGQRIAYVDHRDPAAFSHFWSPVVVVRDIATGTEVGRWTLDGAVSCLEYAVDWIVACEADDATLGSGAPDQNALVAINPSTDDLNRVDTGTRVFLPAG